MSYSASTIASFFINEGIKENSLISNMKLQKLLYYAQGWHMAYTDGEPLIDEDFEKWTFGPVCKKVYYKYRHLKADPISDEEKSHEPIEEEIEDFLRKIFRAYQEYSAIQLSRLSHLEDPWNDASDFDVISKESIFKFFRNEKNDIKKHAAQTS